jgi:hypothetical protein
MNVVELDCQFVYVVNACKFHIRAPLSFDEYPFDWSFHQSLNNITLFQIAMNTLHLGRNPIFQPAQGTTNSPATGQELIPINDALQSSIIQKVSGPHLHSSSEHFNTLKSSRLN